MNNYADFEVWIGAPMSGLTSPGASSVQVISSPAGQAQGELSLDLQDPGFQTDLAKVRGIEPDIDLRKSFGERLFNALFKNEVRDMWKISLGRIDANQAEGLRLRLRIDPPELSLLPWELLRSDDFLATSGSVLVSRYLPVPEPPSFTAQKPLKILIVAESPPGVPEIDPKEIDRLEAAVTSLGNKAEHLLLKNVTAAHGRRCTGSCGTCSSR